MAETPEDFLKSITLFPEHPHWYAFLTQLARELPSAFLGPPPESIVEMLAYAAASKNWRLLYMIGGLKLALWVQDHLEQHQRHEECAQIDQTLDRYGPSTERLHDHLRASPDPYAPSTASD